MKVVDVCGVPFEVKEVESNSRDDGAMGRCDTKMALITLNKDMPKSVKDSTLIHEWIHGVLESQGMSEFSQDEKLVSVLQNELYRNGFRVKETETGIVKKGK